MENRGPCCCTEDPVVALAVSLGTQTQGPSETSYTCTSQGIMASSLPSGSPFSHKGLSCNNGTG